MHSYGWRNATRLDHVIAREAADAAERIGAAATPTEVWQEIAIAIRRTIAVDRRERGDPGVMRREWAHGLATGIGVALLCMIAGGAIIHILHY